MHEGKAHARFTARLLLVRKDHKPSDTGRFNIKDRHPLYHCWKENACSLNLCRDSHPHDFFASRRMFDATRPLLETIPWSSINMPTSPFGSTTPRMARRVQAGGNRRSPPCNAPGRVYRSRSCRLAAYSAYKTTLEAYLKSWLRSSGCRGCIECLPASMRPSTAVSCRFGQLQPGLGQSEPRRRRGRKMNTC